MLAGGFLPSQLVEERHKQYPDHRYNGVAGHRGEVPPCIRPVPFYNRLIPSYGVEVTEGGNGQV